MEKTEKDFLHIKGWGVDADPKNDPTYPIKNRTNAEHDGYTWERPPQQPIDLEVLHSNERPNITAVFGATLPPKGLSGMIRRYAFKYGESSYGHWLPLILADRVDVVEGVLDDLMHGHLPNIIKEKGLKVDWEHDRQGLLQSVAIGIAGIAAVAFLLRKR